MPDLIEIQKNSYKWFLEEGMADLFDEISPVTDFIGRDLELYFEEYYLDEPKFNEAESKAKNVPGRREAGEWFYGTQKSPQSGWPHGGPRQKAAVHHGCS